jgi:hypothetical protein
MQTFLPSGSSLFAAQALDNKRLNKQILEGYQILNVLSTDGKAWRNHPAVLMWEGHEGALYEYLEDMITEAKHRGIKTVNNEINLFRLNDRYGKFDWGWEKPEWMQDKQKLSRVVATHRANLYRKDPEFYAEYASAVSSSYNKPCCDKCLYYWPTHPLKKKN